MTAPEGGWDLYHLNVSLKVGYILFPEETLNSPLSKQATKQTNKKKNKSYCYYHLLN